MPDERFFSTRKLVLGLAHTAALAWLFHLTLAAYHPLSAHVPVFSSDSGVAVMMANDRIWNSFRWYFFGMDRVGLWPYLGQKIYATLTGAHVGFEAFFYWHALQFFLGFIPFFLLCRSTVLSIPVYFLVALSEPSTAGTNFDICTGFPWQITTMLWSLWAAKAVFDGSETRDVRRLLGPRLVIFASTFLAGWIAFSAAPLLIMATGLAAISWAKGIRPLKLVFEPMLGAIALERGFNAWYRHKNHDLTAVTSLSIDWSALPDNFSGVLQSMKDHSQLYPLWIGAMMVALLLGLPLIKSARRGSTQPAVVELGMVGLLLACLSFGNFGLTVLSSHVRFNQFHFRYSATTLFFGYLACGAFALGGLKLLRGFVPPTFLRTSLRRGAPFLGYLVAGFAIPEPAASPESLKLVKATRNAEAYLEGHPEIAKPVPIVGGYWGTSVFVGLETSEQFFPVSIEGDVDRMLWYRYKIAQAHDILVSDYLYNYPLQEYVGFFDGFFRRVGPAAPLGAEPGHLWHYRAVDDWQLIVNKLPQDVSLCVPEPKAWEIDLDPTHLDFGQASLLFLEVHRGSTRSKTRVIGTWNKTPVETIDTMGGLIVKLPPRPDRQARLNLRVEALDQKRLHPDSSCLVRRVYASAPIHPLALKP